MHEINRTRLEALFSEISEIGKTDQGGVTRLAYTADEVRAKKAVCAFFDDCPGVSISTDAYSNLFVSTETAKSGGKVIALGSHLDTPVNGGRFDGAAGVVVAAEVLRSFVDAGYDIPLEVISFACEESSRFGMSSIGSRAMTGQLDWEQVLDLQDSNQIRLRNAFESLGLRTDVQHLMDSTPDSERYRCYLELHVEQGPKLEIEKASFGVVDIVAGASRYHVCITGKARHSGTTPVGVRCDALVGASRCVVATRDAIIRQNGDGVGLVGGVGVLTLPNSSVNVVPGSAEFVLEVRDTDSARKARIVRELREEFGHIAGEEGLQLEIRTLKEDNSRSLCAQVRDVIEQVCEERNASWIRMNSGASHDALILQAAGIDSGLVFIPSVDGISHHPDEDTPMKYLFEAAELLAETVLKISQS